MSADIEANPVATYAHLGSALVWCWQCGDPLCRKRVPKGVRLVEPVPPQLYTRVLIRGKLEPVCEGCAEVVREKVAWGDVA